MQSFKKLSEIIENSISELKERDSYLLENDIHEQAISHKLACYISRQILDWHVDAEYNRNISVPKSLRINGKKSNVRPDILVHRRGKNNDFYDDNNLLIIEIKKNPTPTDRENDLDKIKAFIREDPYYYKFGALISFEGLASKIEWLARNEDDKYS
jgi:hypothetical protein